MGKLDSAQFQNPLVYNSELGKFISEIYNIDLDNLHGMPGAEWWTNYRKTIVNARDYKLRDTRLIAAGQTVAAKVHPFFNIELNGSDTSLDGSLTINPKSSGSRT